MPFYRYWPYRRRRRFWRRRARAPFRRRRYWRYRYRKYRVRKPRRKLKKITLKEWQPSKIRKLKITGKYPLFHGPSERLGHNLIQYLDSTAPHLFPSGGLFSIIVFTLNGLYELHTKARNWWTTTNCNFPLIKYLGCKFTLYRSLEADYVSVYARCGSLTATEELYRSTQPSILLLNKNKKIVTCKKNNYKRKIAKTMKIPPPSLMQNKWYFQKDFANFPLVMLLTSALSLDRFYTSADSISNTLGFISLNTNVFQYSDFKPTTLTQPYKPNDEYWLGTWTNLTVTSFESVELKNLILLGNTKEYQPGSPVDNPATYFTDRKKWGNPLYAPYLEPEPNRIIIIKNLDRLKTATLTDKLQNLECQLMADDKHLLTYCRYNPQNDRSAHNLLYVSNINGNRIKWPQPSPSKPELSTDNLPLWLLPWGFYDWLLKKEAVRNLDYDYVFVIQSDYINPHLPHYIPLDYNITQGKSPFETDTHIRPYDKIAWYPKVSFQQTVISEILNTGPGTIKLPPRISVEGSMKYVFYFKVGGCPPPMDNVCNPQTQPDFPVPSNIISPTLLQDPELPLQYYIQAFDQRRDILTKKAAKRLKTDYSTEQAFLSSTGQTAMDVKVQTPETTSTEDSSTEEEEPQTLQLQLQRHRRKQRKLRNRILQLLKLAKDI